jgi:hypothetical protein
MILIVQLTCILRFKYKPLQSEQIAEHKINTTLQPAPLATHAAWLHHKGWNFTPFFHGSEIKPDI